MELRCCRPQASDPTGASWDCLDRHSRCSKRCRRRRQWALMRWGICTSSTAQSWNATTASTIRRRCQLQWCRTAQCLRRSWLRTTRRHCRFAWHCKGVCLHWQRQTCRPSWLMLRQRVDQSRESWPGARWLRWSSLRCRTNRWRSAAWTSPRTTVTGQGLLSKSLRKRDWTRTRQWACCNRSRTFLRRVKEAHWSRQCLGSNSWHWRLRSLRTPWCTRSTRRSASCLCPKSRQSGWASQELRSAKSCDSWLQCLVSLQGTCIPWSLMVLTERWTVTLRIPSGGLLLGRLGLSWRTLSQARGRSSRWLRLRTFRLRCLGWLAWSNTWAFGSRMSQSILRIRRSACQRQRGSSQSSLILVQAPLQVLASRQHPRPLSKMSTVWKWSATREWRRCTKEARSSLEREKWTAQQDWTMAQSWCQTTRQWPSLLMPWPGVDRPPRQSTWMTVLAGWRGARLCRGRSWVRRMPACIPWPELRGRLGQESHRGLQHRSWRSWFMGACRDAECSDAWRGADQQDRTSESDRWGEKGTRVTRVATFWLGGCTAAVWGECKEEREAVCRFRHERVQEEGRDTWPGRENWKEISGRRHRRHGPQDVCESYRSLLVSSHPGKVIHKALRSHQCDVFEQYLQGENNWEADERFLFSWLCTWPRPSYESTSREGAALRFPSLAWRKLSTVWSGISLWMHPLMMRPWQDWQPDCSYRPRQSMISTPCWRKRMPCFGREWSRTCRRPLLRCTQIRISTYRGNRTPVSHRWAQGPEIRGQTLSSVLHGRVFWRICSKHWSRVGSLTHFPGALIGSPLELKGCNPLTPPS